MSLIINLISKDPSLNNEDIEAELLSLQSDLFGFEIWREKVWGSSVLKMLGCEMLNSLQTTNIYAFDSDIIKLKIELNSVLENIKLVSRETGENRKSVELRVNNALAYIKVAKKHIDKIGIAIG